VHLMVLKHLKSLSLMTLTSMIISFSYLPEVAQAQTPPTQSQDSTRRLELARKLIELDGTKTQSEEAINEILPLMEMAIANEDGFKDLPQKDKAKIAEFMGQAFFEMIPQILETLAKGYAKELSEPELTELVSFYSGQTAQKYVKAQSQINTTTEKEMNSLAEQAALKALTRYFQWKTQRPT
jgi:hypothetical protein